MIKFKRYPYRVGETYGMNGGLTQRQITMAINKPERQAKKLRAKAPLLAGLIEGGKVENFDPEAEYQRRQKLMDEVTQYHRDCEAKRWRKGRKRFFELDEATQKKVIEEWEKLTIGAGIRMPAESSRFCGVVDRVSGDQAKRLAECEKRHLEYMAKLKAEENKQLDFFGVPA